MLNASQQDVVRDMAWDVVGDRPLVTARTRKALIHYRMIDFLAMLAYPAVFRVEQWPNGDELAALFKDATAYYTYDWEPGPWNKMRDSVLDYAQYGNGTIQDAEAAIDEWLEYIAATMKRLRIGVLDYRVFEVEEDPEDDQPARVVPDREREYLNQWFKFMVKGQKSAHVWLRNNTGGYATDKVKRAYVDADGARVNKATKSLVPSLEQLASQLLGKNVTGREAYLDTDQTALRAMADKAGQLGTEYREVLRMLNELQREETNKFLRKQPDPVPLPELNDHLKRLGLRPFPEGFVGLIGANPSPTKSAPLWYTSKGEELEGGPTPQASEVKMNPNYVPGGQGGQGTKFYVMVKTGATTNRFTTGQATSKSIKKKFQKVRYSLKKGETLSKKWRKHLKDPTSRFHPVSAIVELMYITGGRIGTPGTAGVGLSTLRNGNLRFKGQQDNPTSVNIKYAQKKANHHYLLKRNDSFFDTLSKDAVNRLLDVMAQSIGSDSEKDDYVFHKPNGAPLSRDVLKFIKGQVGLPKSHMLRYMKATGMFMDGLATIKEGWKASQYAPSASDLVATVIELAERAANQLGHVINKGDDGVKPNIGTTLKYYIDPSAIIGLFSGMGQEVPAALRKRMHKQAFA